MQKIIFIVFVLFLSGFVFLSLATEKWIFLGIAFVPLLLYISIKEPFIFPFGLYAFFLPFDTILSISGNAEGATITKFLGILTILVFFFKAAIEKRLRFPNFSAIWWILFVSYGVLSVVWAIDPKLTTSTIPTAIGLLLLYLSVSVIRIEEHELAKLKWCILVGGVTAALFTIYLFSTGIGYKGITDRASIIIGARAMSPNIFALSLLIPISICIEIMLQKTQRTIRALFIAMLFIMTLSVILTGSRGGVLGLAVLFLIYAMKNKQKLFLTTALITVCVFIALMLPDFIMERWGSAVETGGSGRLSIWYVAYKALEKYWVIGAGLSNFTKAFNEFFHYAPTFVSWSRSAHNFFIGMFIELGIVGIILMTVAIIKHYQLITLKTDRYSTSEVMLKAAFWAVLVSSLFLSSYWLKSFWLIWMLIIMHNNIYETQDSKIIK